MKKAKKNIYLCVCVCVCVCGTDVPIPRIDVAGAGEVRFITSVSLER